MTRKRLEHELAQLAIASPQVIGQRLWRMGASGWLGQLSRAADRAEWRRMHQEKLDALQDGWVAMCVQGMRVQQEWSRAWWLACMQPWNLPAELMKTPQRVEAAMCDVVASGLAPARKRAVANARRLRRSGPR